MKSFSMTWLRAVPIMIAGSIIFCACVPPGACQDIQDRFGQHAMVTYKVYCNAIPSGYITWEYQGRQEINGVAVDALYMNSDADIIKIIDIKGKEKIFLDVQTHLPFKVERDLMVFGKKEFIEEWYEQETGSVRVSNNGKETMYTPGAPVYNILALMYFFPVSLEAEKGREYSFNLPTQKVHITFHREGVLKTSAGNKEVWLLVGKGAKRFNVWMDKVDHLPVRLEFLFPLGKVSIVRQYQDTEKK